MKHKYRNYYFPVLICIVFCLCIFLDPTRFFCQDTNKCFSSGYRSQTEFFFFELPLILNFQSSATEI